MGQAIDGRSRSGSALQPVAVFGGAGGGSFAAMVLRRVEAAGGRLRFAGLLNDAVAAGARIGTDPVLGPFPAWRDCPPETGFLAPLHKSKVMQTRKALIERLQVPPERWVRVIDPNAIVATDAVLGAGCFVASQATVMPQVRLGGHVAIRSGVCIGHDAVLGNFCFVGFNAVVGGYARIADGVFLGVGALVRENIAIGRYSVIGMGAVVVRDVPDFAIVAGNPAKVIGRVPPISEETG